jgi:predicted metallo-beta-lactamase superfamily hydrolase
MTPKTEIVMSNEWLVKNRKLIRKCPNGTIISKHACEKRINTLPHRHYDRGTPSLSQYFLLCKDCEHYYEPILTPEEIAKQKKERFNRDDQERIDKHLARKSNAKRNLQQS